MNSVLYSQTPDSHGGLPDSPSHGSGFRTHTLALGAVLLVLYGLLWHGYWVPETDGAVYLSVARGLVLGEGWHFNGSLPVIIPPVWPVVLAGLFRFSPSFAWLNLVSLLTMVAGVLVWHRILLRLTGPAMAFGAAFLTAMTWNWFRLATLPFTDPLALLLLSLAVLLALRWREGAGGRCSLALVPMLVCLAVLVRYGALLGAILVAAAWLHGGGRGRDRVAWLSALLCLVAALAMVVGTRFGYERMLEHASADMAAVSRSGFGVDVGRQYGIIQHHPSVLAPGYVGRVIGLGNWVAGVLYGAPAEAVAASGIGWGLSLSGWVLFLCLLAAAWARAGRERWLFAGAAVYTGIIAFRWPNLNARYLVPAVPLLLLGIAEGVERIGRLAVRSRERAWPRRLAWVFLAAVGAANLPSYAMAVRAARSADFYGAYREESRQMVEIAHELVRRGAGDGEVAVTRHFDDDGRMLSNQYAFRCLVLLTGRHIRSVPARIRTSSDIPASLPWFAANGVRYLVYRPPGAVGRVGGVRMPRLAAWFAGRQGRPLPRIYELHEITGNGLRPVIPPRAPGWPKAVPFVCGDREAGRDQGCPCE